MDDDVDMALDIDLGMKAAPARPKSRFQPKLKGKLVPKSAPEAEPESHDASLPPITKQENYAGTEKPDEAPVVGDHSGADFLDFLDGEEDFNLGMSAMEVDDLGGNEEDVDPVVREIDVFFNPSPLDLNTQLYLMQYPLRPSWRPYELNDRCQEVRIKPKQSKIEIDLAIDVSSDNYDNEVADHLKLTKRTLRSSNVRDVSRYAIGVLMGNKLHLNPVHAVMQFRPSLSHMDSSGLITKKQVPQKTNVPNKDVETTEYCKPSTSREMTGTEIAVDDKEVSEDWISLKYHGADSPISSKYQRKMMTEVGDPIPFLANQSEYLDKFCPGRSTSNDTNKGPTTRVLMSLPLNDRLKKLFLEMGQIHKFNAIMHLAPSESPESTLTVIQQYANLVQGLWISKSSFLYEGRQALVRDYILILFSKNNTIPISKIKEINLPMEEIKSILSSLAFERSICKDWKFREPTDMSFIKRFPYIVKMQEGLWSRREEQIMSSSSGILKTSVIMSKCGTKPGSGVKSEAGDVDQRASKSTESIADPVMWTLSEEIRDALPKALMELFRSHRVCSMNQIRQGLREMAVSKSTLPKGDPRVFVLAAHGASAPAAELESIVRQVAEKIHDVFVLKSSNNPALNPLRHVIIQLLRGRPPTEKLKKAEIVAAVRMSSLEKEFAPSDFNQVLSEFCVSNKGAGWLLKSGDDMPK